jgi:hypothetical protein
MHIDAHDAEAAKTAISVIDPDGARAYDDIDVFTIGHGRKMRWNGAARKMSENLTPSDRRDSVLIVLVACQLAMMAMTWRLLARIAAILDYMSS